MQRKVMLILACLVLAGLGCSSRSAVVQTENPQDQLRVIVHLETRNEVVSVMSGPNGRVYTVKSKDGKMLEHQISELELSAKFPAIYRLLKSSHASDDKGNAFWGGW